MYDISCVLFVKSFFERNLSVTLEKVAHEGRLAKESIASALRQGDKRHGDMIPWLISEQFRQLDFGELNGARIVRIATHPDFLRAGYGKEALKQLEAYYKGEIPLSGMNFLEILSLTHF